WCFRNDDVSGSSALDTVFSSDGFDYLGSDRSWLWCACGLWSSGGGLVIVVTIVLIIGIGSGGRLVCGGCGVCRWIGRGCGGGAGCLWVGRRSGSRGGVVLARQENDAFATEVFETALVDVEHTMMEFVGITSSEIGVLFGRRRSGDAEDEGSQDG